MSAPDTGAPRTLAELQAELEDLDRLISTKYAEALMLQAAACVFFATRDALDRMYARQARLREDIEAAGRSPVATAMNSSGAAETAVAYCRDVSPIAGQAPKLVQLLPIGPAIQGRDGRAWTMRDAAAVVRNTELPMVLDYEHATEIKAPQGEPAPAAGWITGLELVPVGNAREPGIWGRVVWTERGRQSVVSREYRSLSPVFQHTKSTAEVVKLLNAALTNRPNLRMTALNQHQEPPVTTPITPDIHAAAAKLSMTPAALQSLVQADQEATRAEAEHANAVNLMKSRELLQQAPAGYGAGTGLSTEELAICWRGQHDPKAFAAFKASEG